MTRYTTCRYCGNRILLTHEYSETYLNNVLVIRNDDGEFERHWCRKPNDDGADYSRDERTAI